MVGFTVVLVSVAVIVVLPAAPDTPPVTPACTDGAAHAYVVLAGIKPVGVYVNGRFVHIDVVCEAILATGLIVTVTVNTVPVVQIPDVGVTL